MTDLWLLGHVLDRLRELADRSVHMSVTSPPYFGLRDYGTDPQDWPEVTFAPMPGLPPMTIPAMCCSLGNEPDPWAFVGHMVLVFREVRRVLRDDGTLWVNLGDSYASTSTYNVPRSSGGEFGRVRAERQPNAGIPDGLKGKDLIGIPWRVAFALQADGWYLRMDNIWHKPNPMPESVTDRPTKAHEYVFLLAKSARYFYDVDAVREPHEMKPQRRPGGRPTDETPRPGQPKQAWPTAARDEVGIDGNPAGRNKRSVWTVTPQPFAEAHFATMPPALAEVAIRAGTSEHGCCATCGAPWERVTEKVGEASHRGGERKHAEVKTRQGATGALATGVSAIRATTGWRPTCDHGGDPVPCTVLDIFGGAGTTPMVARRLRRSFIYVELNPEYREIAWRRFVGDAPLFNRVPA